MPATYDLRRRRTPDAHFPSAVFRGNIRVSQMRVSADPHFQLGPFVRGPSGQYSWGSGVLRHLYRSLCRAARFDQSVVGGCLILLQLWAWERLPFTRPGGILPVLQNDAPYAARGGSVLILGQQPLTTLLQHIETNSIDVKWKTVGRRLIGNPDHRQTVGYLQTSPSYISTVEALRHISIQGAIAAEQGQSNNYTNVKQQIATDEPNRLNYGYVLQFPRTACAYFYEPIDQVLGPDQRRQGNRRGRAVQGGHRRQHSPHINLNDEVHMEVQHDDPEMGDVTQQDFTQTLMSQSPFRTPYVAHGHVFEDGSSSQSPRHVARQVRSPSNQIPNAPFEHPI
nr:serine/threonine-protein phosphatase 7 long form homolog [Ipomoea batatas]GME05902.1 serine/threonine-protein phosphatase 7 long form homolog [Ipomoea batatas]